MACTHSIHTSAHKMRTGKLLRVFLLKKPGPQAPSSPKPQAQHALCALQNDKTCIPYALLSTTNSLSRRPRLAKLPPCATVSCKVCTCSHAQSTTHLQGSGQHVVLECQLWAHSDKLLAIHVHQRTALTGTVV